LAIRLGPTSTWPARRQIDHPARLGGQLLARGAAADNGNINIVINIVAVGKAAHHVRAKPGVERVSLVLAINEMAVLDHAGRAKVIGAAAEGQDQQSYSNSPAAAMTWPAVRSGARRMRRATRSMSSNVRGGSGNDACARASQYVLSNRVIFFAAAHLAVPALIALTRIRSAEVDFGRSVGVPDHREPTPSTRAQHAMLWTEHKWSNDLIQIK
jgi:hypothetical protein